MAYTPSGYTPNEVLQGSFDASTSSLRITATTNSGIAATLKQTQVTLTAAGTVYQLPASKLTNRKCLIIANPNASTFYVGGSNVTATSGVNQGIPIPANGSITLSTTAAVYAVSASASQIVNVLELA